MSAGHSLVDHMAPMLNLEFFTVARQAASGRAMRPDARAVSDPCNADVVVGIIRSAPRPPWQMDSSEHAAVVVDHLYTQLVKHFPMDRRRLRASFLSDVSATLHQAVSALRHAVRSKQTALRMTYLRCAFQAWTSPDQAFDCLFTGSWLWQLRSRLGGCCMLLRRYGRQLREQCRVDKAAHFSKLADEIAAAPSGDTHRAVKRVLRPKKFRRASADPLPTLEKADGSLCTNVGEVADTWREYFCALEGGVETTDRELVNVCRAAQASQEGPDTLDAASMPTWLTLEAAFRHSAPRKAAGPDLLPPCICRAFSPQMAELFWPLLLKTICRASEPVGLKGGVMFHISKGKPGLQNTCAAHRGILAQSCLSKVFHRSLRGLVVEHWQKFALPLQLGGRAGCSAVFGQLCSRSVLCFARQMGLSSGLLFVDLQAAYYAVVRETILGGGLVDRPVVEIASALGLDRDDLQMLKHFAEVEPALQSHDLNPLLLSLARELHRQTWFVLAEDPSASIVATQRGTRPGGTMADVLFNVLFARVLARRSADSAAFPAVPWEGNRTPFPTAKKASAPKMRISDIVYADDLCTPVVTTKAAQLRGALSAVTADTMDILTPHALRPNLGPTKTAAVVAPLGPGSRQARHEMFVTLKGRTPVWPESKGLHWLDLVPRYRHLGALVSHDCRMGPEVRHRLSLASSAFKEGKRKLFACQRVPISKRSMLLRSHVLSVLLVGAGTWPSLSKQDWRTFTGGVLGFYRQLLGLRSTGDWHQTEGQLLMRVSLPSPGALLQAERLRVLGQLVLNAPDQVWALIAWNEPFQAALREAGNWLLTAVGATASLGPMDSDWSSWSSLIKTRPGQWKGLIRRAEAWDVEVNRLRGLFDTVVRQLWSNSQPQASSPLEGMEHGCLVCGLAFCSQQQWGAHAQRLHGYRNLAARLASGRKCQACHTVYATPARLKRHLLFSGKCRHYLEQNQEVSVRMTDLSVGHCQAPAFRAFASLDLQAAPPELCQGLLAALQALTCATDQEIFDLVASFIAPLPMLRQTLRAWMDSLPEGELLAAAEDVLLILKPEHVCSSICGRVPDQPALRSFSPVIRRPVHRAPSRIQPVRWFGALDARWVDRWGLVDCSTLPLDLTDLSDGPVPCSGLCVLFASPPAADISLFPTSMPLRGLRLRIEWLSSLFRILPCLLSTALLGIPVSLRVPVEAVRLEPLSTWLLEAAQASADKEAPNCFTLEFNAIGTSFRH